MRMGYYVRSRFAWDISDTVTADIIFDYTDEDGTQGGTQIDDVAPFSSGFGTSGFLPGCAEDE